MRIFEYPLPTKQEDRKGEEIDLLVMHYTAGNGEALATAKVFEAPGRTASAHFIVSRNGEIAHCVPIERAAWHAGDGGKSKFPKTGQLLAKTDPNGQGFVPLASVPRRPHSLNRRSIGIEICNRGWAPKKPGTPLFYGRHRNPASHSTEWEMFPQAQVDAVHALAYQLVQEIPTLRWVTGHEDVTNQDTLGAPGGKLDPGPAWPWPPIPGLLRVYFDFRRKGWAY